MAVTIQQATSVVEASGPAAPPVPPMSEAPPGQAEMERTAELLRMLERERRRLCAELFDD